MRRSIAAYLADIIDACEHIVEATAGLDAEGYLQNKTIRRSVERDFQIIGEGLIQLRERAPDTYARYREGPMIIGLVMCWCISTSIWTIAPCGIRSPMTSDRCLHSPGRYLKSLATRLMSDAGITPHAS